MSNSINALALAAAENDSLREELICQQEQLILNTASRASYRYITKSDDEWTVALGAFSSAIDKYKPERGDFIPFSQMLMKRALIDYHRVASSHLTEISTSPFVLEGFMDDAEDTAGLEKSIYLAVVEKSQERSDNSLREEILSANEMLRKYGFRFFDLVECSPKQEKTKMDCARAIRCVLSDSKLLKELEAKKKLPIRKIESASGISKKVLDRYRKYIVMAILILSGDYPKISEYLKFVGRSECI